jgi:ferredoxin
MPTITAQSKTFDCPLGSNLRQVLLSHGIDLYNGGATLINCRALGTCGTCAVHLIGDASAMTWREQARLSLPPHAGRGDRRLACQVKVQGDLHVTKLDGFWGQGDRPVWTPTQSRCQG